MDTVELADATKEFNWPFVFDNARPMNLAERKEWDRAKHRKADVSQKE